MIVRHLRSNIVGYVALFLALTAGAYAAGLKKNSVKSKTIKDGQVTREDLASNSVDSSKVIDGSLSGADFGGTLPQGPQGPPGSPDTGAQILTKLDEVDGPGSGLDADYLDGFSSGYYVKTNDDAGGDLSGQYPSPGIADGAVGVDETGQLPAARVEYLLDSTDCTGFPEIAGDGSLQTLAFSQESFDFGGLFTQAPCGQLTRLMAPRPGVYAISANVTWDSQASAGAEPSGGTRFAGIRLNGNDDRYVVASRISGLPGNQVPEQPLSTIVRLQANDYAELVVGQDSGTTIVITGTYERQSFQMTWLAPG